MKSDLNINVDVHGACDQPEQQVRETSHSAKLKMAPTSGITSGMLNKTSLGQSSIIDLHYKHWLNWKM